MAATWICLFVLVGAALLPHWLPGLRTGHDKPVFFVLGLAIAVMLVMLRACLAQRAGCERARGTVAGSLQQQAAPLARPRRQRG